jgi:integrase
VGPDQKAGKYFDQPADASPATGRTTKRPREMSYVRNVIRSAPRTLSLEEAEQLLEATGQHVDGFRDHVIFHLALATALREHEIVALNVGDVVREIAGAAPRAARGPRRPGRAARGPRRPGRAARGPGVTIRTWIQLRVFKRSRHAAGDVEDQQVVLPRIVRLKLEKFIGWKKKHGEDLRPGAPLFLSRFRRRLSTRQIRNLNEVWQQRAGFDRVHPFHRMRHTALSQLYDSTGDVLLVQKAARHASGRSTEIYMHPSNDRLQAEVEKLHRR